MAIQLVPVIEFSASYFQAQTYDYPPGGVSDYPQEWYVYWQRSLADSGITDLEPYDPGSSYVEVSRLTSEIMEIYFTKYERLQGELDNIGSLSGGYVFCGEWGIMPECCGSLQDISEWEMAANCREETPKMLWIGHPWLMVKSIDDRVIQIADEDGNGMNVDRAELKLAIESARQQLANFQEVLLSAVIKIRPDITQAIALQVTLMLIFGSEGTIDKL